MIGYGRALIGAAAYDPVSGIALFPLPREAPALKAGKRLLNGTAADFQEAKNVDSVGDELLPNTAFASGNITVVNRPAVTWVTPETNECAPAQTPLLVLASSTAALRSVRFFDGRKLLATDKQRRRRHLLRGLEARRSGEGQAHAAGDRHRREGPEGRSTARRARLQ